MTYFGSTEWWFRVQAGEVPGYYVRHPAGYVEKADDKDRMPLTDSVKYPMPASAVALEIVSDNANDSAAGTGAQKVEISGLDDAWEEFTVEVTMNGVTPVALPITVTRVFDVRVSEAGTYPTEADDIPPNVGEITLRVAGGGDTWHTIFEEVGRSFICCYSVPAGYRAFLVDGIFSVKPKDTDEGVEFLAFAREAIDQSSPAKPFLPLIYHIGQVGMEPLDPTIPWEPLTGPADIIMTVMGTKKDATATAELAILVCEVIE